VLPLILVLANAYCRYSGRVHADRFLQGLFNALINITSFYLSLEMIPLLFLTYRHIGLGEYDEI
jgi:hypothetical protein